MSRHEPTEEMILAGIAAANRTMPYFSDAQCVAEIWKAMQAARATAIEDVRAEVNKIRDRAKLALSGDNYKDVDLPHMRSAFELIMINSVNQETDSEKYKLGLALRMLDVFDMAEQARAVSPKVPECPECPDTGMIMLGEEDGIHQVVACIRCGMETDARVSLSLKIPQSCACSREITTGWTSDNGIPLCNVCGMVDVSAAFEMAKEPPKVPHGVEDAYQALQNELIQIQATIESFATPAAALSALIDWHVSVATDPRVNGGRALVPVDDLDVIAEVVRGMLHTAYQNAMPVCCGKPGQQCCGNPDPEWSAEDMKVMDSLGPIEKRISAMLAATKEKGE